VCTSANQKETRNPQSLPPLPVGFPDHVLLSKKSAMQIEPLVGAQRGKRVAIRVARGTKKVKMLFFSELWAVSVMSRLGCVLETF
jgi:hypothetical protein